MSEPKAVERESCAAILDECFGHAFIVDSTLNAIEGDTEGQSSEEVTGAKTGLFTRLGWLNDLLERLQERAKRIERRLGSSI